MQTRFRMSGILQSRTSAAMLAVILAFLWGSVAFGQSRDSPVLSGGAALLTSVVIDEAKEAAGDLIAQGFDRLDRSVVHAATEVQATVNQLGLQLSDSQQLMIGELDGQQRRAVEDLMRLTATITRLIRDGTLDILGPLQQDMHMLLSRNPGHVLLSAEVIGQRDQSVDLTLRGTALSRVQNLNLRVGAVGVESRRVHSDDERIVLRVPLDQAGIRNLVDSLEATIVTEIPFTFDLEECPRFSLSCSTRTFLVNAYALREVIGVAKAVFVGDVTIEERKYKRVGPFTSGRVRSTVFGERGSRVDNWVALPDSGWRIDTSTAQFEFNLLINECSGRRSGASWTRQTEQVLRVRATTTTQSNPLVNCQSRTTIRFMQWRNVRVQSEYESEPVVVRIGENNVLGMFPDTELENARLSHVIVESGLFRGGSRVLRAGDSTEGLHLEYDAAVQTAFVDVRF